ncbi:glycosyltransferase [Sphingomonas baiyangensis]|uniref:Glycosyltransferase n=1 Tax=Sphingomonas baiyangensis TaxID=2572576 RepID=A0A4V5PTV1_9SPHN|nr:glycosyltransferase [Sphingomonas baiyangensis]TKD51538.1 glycosyltransferase [Sphingomonas baiyangensis]
MREAVLSHTRHSREGSSLTPVAICIPARNEAAELPRLFDALERLHPQPAHVCFLLNGCSDDSEALVRRYRDRALPRIWMVAAKATCTNVGQARHLAMQAGLAALNRTSGLLLTTDADSRPAPDWVATMTQALTHADAVAGRIVRQTERPSALQDRLEAYYDALFALRRRLDPVPWEAAATHHYGGGANLGIRADAYRALGGFAPVATGEDAALLDAAARAGLRVRRDAACVVETSDRREGRCPGGLAEALRQSDMREASATIVAHPADETWQYRLHADARRAFDAGQPHRIAAALSLTPDHAVGVARECPNGEAFAMRIVPVPPGGMRNVPLPVAEAELAAMSLGRVAA